MFRAAGPPTRYEAWYGWEIALVGSGGTLELAIVDDSAAAMLGVTVGTPVTITW